MSSSKIILCVLGAAAAGAVVGSMLTSGKGAEWISRIRNAAGEWSNKESSEDKSSSETEPSAHDAETNAPGIA